jgi:hypothetical protein
VHGRDESLSRLPSAAEPTQPITICQLDFLDSTTIHDHPILHALITTDWNDLPTETSNGDIANDERFRTCYRNTITDDTSVLSVDDHQEANELLHAVQFPDPHESTYSNYDDVDTDPSTTTSINELSALDDQLQQLGLTRSEYYARLRIDESAIFDNDVTIHAHFDGGSMASTTDKQHCLWHYRDFDATEHPQMLQVADRHQHRPLGIGFLRVPITSRADDSTSCLVRCLFTPTLPATIVSPHDIGIQYQCIGYSSMSNFDGSNCVV